MKDKQLISLDSEVSRKDNVIDCTIDNEIVLMSVDNGEYINLNRQASAVWELVETPKKISEIILQLQNKFEVDRAECESDVLNFIKTLSDENVINIS